MNSEFLAILNDLLDKETKHLNELKELQLKYENHNIISFENIIAKSNAVVQHINERIEKLSSDGDWTINSGGTLTKNNNLNCSCVIPAPDIYWKYCFKCKLPIVKNENC